MILLVKCHLYQATRGHTLMPHLLLLIEETEGPQLVLMYTLILQMEPTVVNPGISSERVLHGDTNLKSASPTNIDIGFKPHGLQWKEKDAVSTLQLQQMRANERKEVDAAKSSSSIETSQK